VVIRCNTLVSVIEIKGGTKLGVGPVLVLPDEYNLECIVIELLDQWYVAVTNMLIITYLNTLACINMVIGINKSCIVTNKEVLEGGYTIVDITLNKGLDVCIVARVSTNRNPDMGLVNILGGLCVVDMQSEGSPVVIIESTRTLCVTRTGTATLKMCFQCHE